MQIQFNTDKNIAGSTELTASFTSIISKELDRFSEDITRIEIHLSDKDGNKNSPNDKRCMLEARLAGINPIAVTNYADTYELALIGAIEKLKTSLATITGRQKNY